jgi:hypothetical protein
VFAWAEVINLRVSRRLSNSPQEFAEEADANFLQVTGLRQIGYSRALRLASPQYLHERRDPKENQPPLDYDGIEDVFIEKGSLVWYWHAGRWSHLRGAE